MFFIANKTQYETVPLHEILGGGWKSSLTTWACFICCVMRCWILRGCSDVHRDWRRFKTVPHITHYRQGVVLWPFLKRLYYIPHKVYYNCTFIVWLWIGSTWPFYKVYSNIDMKVHMLESPRGVLSKSNLSLY